MNKKTSKRQRDIKSKLMAAICMLLVSSIMMVSTTYAWFTLSTAPEVTGITTAVGANGNLEMALLPADGLTEGKVDYGIKSDAGDSIKIPLLRNVTWGNLVDVSDTATYGLNNISLYPSTLYIPAAEDGTKPTVATEIQANPLATPQYGVDGRVSNLAANTITGAFDTSKGQFIEDANGIEDAMGVRAIGVASSMSARQLAYRTALANASSAAGQANSAAKASLNKRGEALANIAIKHALGTDADGYSEAEITTLESAVSDLLAALGSLESALKNTIIADSIAPSTVTDETYKAISDAITAATLTNLQNGAVSGAVVTDGMKSMITTLTTAKSNAETASQTLSTLTAGATWDQISPALQLIMNADKLRVNGMTMTEINAPAESEGGQTGKDKLVQAIQDAGFNIYLVMPSGSGAYSGIADFTGEYAASIKVTVSYGPINNMTMPANMAVKNITIAGDGTETTTAGTPYLDTYNVDDYDGGGEEAPANPISEYYGYIIDLAFRTNAADSYLQLQTTGIDRVYSDSTTNEATMGHGATMSFKSASSTFGVDQVKSLMSHIRLVFFDPESKEIIRYGKLDMDNGTLGDDNITFTAPMMLTQGDFQTALGSIQIMELEQNTAHALSVMVYLDGTTMSNADVAADAVQSMTGTMNLQFSSSANLKPMEYADLRSENGGTSNQYTTISSVAVPTGWKASSAYFMNNQLAFSLTNTADTATVPTSVEVSIDGGEAISATAGTYMGVPGYAITVPTGTTVTSSSRVTITVDGVAPSTSSTSGGDSSIEDDADATTYTVTLDTANSESGITLSNTTVTNGSCTFSLTGADSAKTYTVTYSMGTTTDATLTATNGSYTISNITDNVTVKVVETA